MRERTNFIIILWPLLRLMEVNMSNLNTGRRGLAIKTIVAIGIGAALVVAIYQVSIPVGFIPFSSMRQLSP